MKLLKKTICLLLVASAFTFTNCATIFTGTRDVIRFDSDPQGAKVYIDGIMVGKTPCSISVKRNVQKTFAEFKLDGYETRLITLDTEFNVISVLNLTNIFAWGIDALTGSVMVYDRKSYDIELDKQNRTSLLDDASKIEINTKDEVIDVFIVEK